METLSTRILTEGAALPEATLIYAKALLHLGSRAAVDQALSRLVRRGRLLRAGRGLYVRPIETRFGPRTPSVEVVLNALQAETGETIAPSGAAAANTLGLTTQVPGPSRRLRFGAQTVELRHAPRWQLTFAGRPSGEVIRALVWFGRERGTELTSQLKRMLSAQTVRELSSARGRMPTWMAEQISALVARA
jgi:hypothetical protein